MPSENMLKSVIREHLADCGQLCRLEDAYHERSTIAARTRSSGLPNNRISHPDGCGLCAAMGAAGSPECMEGW